MNSENSEVSTLKILKMIRILRLLKLLRILRGTRIFARWESRLAIDYAWLNLYTHARSCVHQQVHTHGCRYKACINLALLVH